MKSSRKKLKCWNNRNCRWLHILRKPQNRNVTTFHLYVNMVLWFLFYKCFSEWIISSHESSLVLWAHWSRDVSGPQLQLHLIPQHLAVHCWPERSCHPPGTVSGKSHIKKLHQTSGAVAGNCFKPGIKPSSLPSFCHPGADGAGVLWASAEAGLWDVSAPV